MATFRAGIADVGRYAGIVAKLGVTQAPSIVIVRPDLRAVPPIEGYVESQYLLQRVKDQLVSDDRPHLRPVPAPGTVNEAVARDVVPGRGCHERADPADAGAAAARASSPT